MVALLCLFCILAVALASSAHFLPSVWYVMAMNMCVQYPCRLSSCTPLACPHFSFSIHHLQCNLRFGRVSFCLSLLQPKCYSWRQDFSWPLNSAAKFLKMWLQKESTLENMRRLTWHCAWVYHHLQHSLDKQRAVGSVTLFSTSFWNHFRICRSLICERRNWES